MLGKRKVIGGAKNFWLYSESSGYDLTHPPTPSSPPIYPRLTLQTRRSHATIDPGKTALVVIDLQNYFLSPALGRPSDSVGLGVTDILLTTVIPACRKAGIGIIWLNWGLTDSDIEEMPPAILSGFMSDTNFDYHPNWPLHIGSDIGTVQLNDGNTVKAGRTIMRGAWNSELYAPLQALRRPEDPYVYKNRLSGFWGGTGIEVILAEKGIRTLLFAGVNTDQCVSCSITDAFSKGFDCVMVSDACGTTSPEFARQCVEYNCELAWGFVVTSDSLVKGVDGMLKASTN